MRPVKSVLLFALALVIGHGTVQAIPDRPDLPTEKELRDQEHFRAWFARPDHRSVVAATLREAEKQITPGCGAFVLRDLADFLPYLPASFSDDGSTLQAGLWLEIWKVDLCGEEKRRSILFSVKDGNVRGMAYLPGRTNVDPVLGRDVLSRAAVSAQVYISQETGKPCGTPPVLFDTQLLTLPTDVKLNIDDAPPDIRAYLKENISQMWREDWYFRACGHVAELKIMFLVKKTGGTTFNISKGGVTPGS